MTATTLAGAKSDLFARLASNTTTGTPAASLTDVTRVYNYEPMPGDIVRPVSLTIGTLGADTDFFRFQVRIYAADATQDLTQAKLDSAIGQVDAILGRTGGAATFGPSVWEVVWADEIAAWVAHTEVMVGREDYY